MKRMFGILLVLTALLVLSFVPGQAQVKVEKGFKAGLNLAKFTGDDSEGLDTRTSFTVGGFVKLGISPVVAIQPEVLFSQKGAKGSALGITATFKLDYVEVPVLLRVDIATQGTVTPILYAGPAAGINITSKLKAEAGGVSAEVDIDNAKSLDFGFVFGGGVDFTAGKTKVGFEARYTLGLSNAYDDVTTIGSNDLIDSLGNAPDLKNGVFSIMVGIAF